MLRIFLKKGLIYKNENVTFFSLFLAVIMGHLTQIYVHTHTLWFFGGKTSFKLSLIYATSL